MINYSRKNFFEILCHKTKTTNCIATYQTINTDFWYKMSMFGKQNSKKMEILQKNREEPLRWLFCFNAALVYHQIKHVVI